MVGADIEMPTALPTSVSSMLTGNDERAAFDHPQSVR